MRSRPPCSSLVSLSLQSTFTNSLRKRSTCRGLWAGLWGAMLCFVLLPTSPAQAALSDAARLRNFLAGYPTPQATLQRILWKQPLSPRLLRSLDHRQLRKLRNALFALGQARFRSPELRRLFRAQRWYRPLYALNKVKLPAQARKNLKVLSREEARARRRFVRQLRKRLWGEKPAVLYAYGPKVCLKYQHYQVVQTHEKVRIGRVQKKGNPCVMSRKNTLLTLRRTQHFDTRGEFRGLFKRLVFLWESGTSAMQGLRVVSLPQGKVLWHKLYLPAQADFRFHAATNTLSWYMSLPLPPACKSKTLATFNAAIQRCWSRVRAKNLRLRKTKAPVCRCKGGLGPSILARYKWSLLRPTVKPTLTGEVKCGCSS